jgi:hypothetical protein
MKGLPWQAIFDFNKITRPMLVLRKEGCNMKTKKPLLLVVICFEALCLSAAPAMADFVDLWAYDTLMTVETTGPDFDGTTATTTIVSHIPGSSYMNMYIHDDDGITYQSLELEPYNLTAVLDFTGSGNDYSATGSLVVNDTTGAKIAADFVSTTITFEPLFMNPFSNTIYVSGYLTPQGTNQSILQPEDSSWEFAGLTGTISLLDKANSYDTGNMVVLEYNVNYGSLQAFLAADGATALGMLNATIVPIPTAVLLGIIGLGLVGLKVREYA